MSFISLLKKSSLLFKLVFSGVPCPIIYVWRLRFAFAAIGDRMDDISASSDLDFGLIRSIAFASYWMRMRSHDDGDGDGGGASKDVTDIVCFDCNEKGHPLCQR